MQDNEKTEPFLTIFKKIEKHPFRIYIASIIFAVGVTYGVLDIFHNKEIRLINLKHETEIDGIQINNRTEIDNISRGYERKIEEYENRALSIERNFGGNRYYHIDNFLTQDSNDLQISQKAEFFEDGNFYASLDESRWELIQGGENEIYDLINFGKPNPLLSEIISRISDEMNILLGSSYIWKGKEEVSIEEPTPIKVVFPYIHVSWISHREKDASRDNINKFFRTAFKSLISEKDFESFEKRLCKEDKYLANIYADISLNMSLSEGYRNFCYSISNMQKVNNVFYLQTKKELVNIIINGKEIGKYYITDEMFGITTPTHTYYIKTSVPSRDPSTRHEYFTWVNDWLSDFKIRIQQY